MRNRTREPGFTTDAGVVSFHLERTALCCEATCEAVFGMTPVWGSMRSVVCPACGGSSWVPLSTIVRPLRVAQTRVTLQQSIPGQPIPA